ncbi:MAG: ATP-binding protein, partial [Clostridiales bacterium]|nr:ATP-binding protein [Clostridiales bacterium]
IKADGEVIPIIKSVAKISYKGRLMLLESFVDISNLKKAEEQVRLLAVTEQANKAKSDFLSRMSHEMRTPLNAIIGMTKIAETAADEERRQYCLATIGDSANHLLGLINDILDMSKIEAGKFELHNTTMSFETVMKRMAELFAGDTEKKGIKLNITLDESARIEYIGDEMRISQVITNLMSNAVKFTPESGRVSVKVYEAERRSVDSTIRISVEDSGIGMTEEQMERLFTAFEQADTSISRRFGGTGLGLAISKSIVDMMNGKMWAESEAGKGSTFMFEVELKHTYNAEGYDDTGFEGMRALVATDDERVSDYFRSVTSGCGVITETALSADEMVSLVGAAHHDGNMYDMVLIDYNLKCNDFFKVVKKLKDYTRPGDIVIMASFLAWNRIDEETQNAGVYRFIPLPLLPSRIYKCLRHEDALEGRQNAEDETAEEAVPDFSDITLLYAEDIHINREVFTTLLESTNIKIDTAENGLIAVDMFMQNPDKYNMIIMDVHMPGMNGLEATRAIRLSEAQNAKTIPIIAMTADVFREDVARCLECGMNDHLGKPIDYNAVIKKIAAYSGH